MISLLHLLSKNNDFLLILLHITDISSQIKISKSSQHTALSVTGRLEGGARGGRRACPPVICWTQCSPSITTDWRRHTNGFILIQETFQWKNIKWRQLCWVNISNMPIWIVFYLHFMVKGIESKIIEENVFMQNEFLKFVGYWKKVHCVSAYRYLYKNKLNGILYFRVILGK